MSFKKYVRTRKNLHRSAAAVMALSTVLLMTACGSDSASSDAAETTVTETTVITEEAAALDSEMFTTRDLTQDYDASEAVNVTLSDGSSTSDSSSGISIDNTTNTITITAKGVYVFSGSLSDGQIIVNAAEDEKVQIVLNGVTITNDDSACIYAIEADKLFVTTAEGTENSLSTTGTFVADGDTNVDGVIFAKMDVTLNGLGSLTITSTDHGVVSKDDLKVTGGTLNITAEGKGLSGKDSIRIGGGDITIDATDDGLHSSNDEDETKGWVYIEDGTLNISSGDDGIHADTSVLIEGGNIYINDSYEGIEGQVITVNNCDIYIKSSDDGFNASTGGGGDSMDPMADVDDSCVLTIAGGTIEVDADGDGLDSNGALYVTGGTTYVSGPTNSANGAIDSGTEATITGGIVIAAGASGMAENFGSASTQGSILATVSESTTGTVTITDASGNVLATYTPTKTYNSAVISTPDIVDGETYTVTFGESSQEITMDGLIYGGGMGMMGGGGFGGHGDMDMGDREEMNPEDFDGEMPDMSEMGDFNPEDFDGEMPEMPSDGSAPSGGMGGGRQGGGPGQKSQSTTN